MQGPRPSLWAAAPGGEADPGEAAASASTEGSGSGGEQTLRFSFETYDAMTIRETPTTQVAIRVAGWEGDTFLRCLHSEPAYVTTLAPGAEAVFRQKLYFAEGGQRACVAACEADLVGDPAGEYRFRE